jgi:hypothetical protein
MWGNMSEKVELRDVLHGFDACFNSDQYINRSDSIENDFYYRNRESCPLQSLSNVEEKKAKSWQEEYFLNKAAREAEFIVFHSAP